jgi:hypothetical protein
VTKLREYIEYVSIFLTDIFGGQALHWQSPSAFVIAKVPSPKVVPPLVPPLVTPVPPL